MKKIISTLLAALMLFSAIPFAAATADGIVIDKTWSIRVPKNPTAAQTFAANKLQEGLSEVFGADIAVTTAADTPYIAVGSGAADVSDVANNGYRIRAIDGNLYLDLGGYTLCGTDLTACYKASPSGNIYLCSG